MVFSGWGRATPKSRRDSTNHAGLVMSPKCMLPYTKNAPTLSPERPGDQPVARFIGRQFPSPEGLVGLGLRFVLRAAMPETSINENNKACPTKDKIRFAKELLVATPPGDTVAAEDGY